MSEDFKNCRCGADFTYIIIKAIPCDHYHTSEDIYTVSCQQCGLFEVFREYHFRDGVNVSMTAVRKWNRRILLLKIDDCFNHIMNLRFIDAVKSLAK